MERKKQAPKRKIPERKNLDSKLDELDKLSSQATPEELAKTLDTALADRNNRLVAKAATIVAEKLLYDMMEALVSAYRRFLKDPLKTDKTCVAKRALVRALYELDYNDPAFYIEGMAYRQLEPVWGDHVDSAVELRCSCALGLVASGHARAALALLVLLNDAEPQARIGAVRAIALLEPYQAEIILRAKVLQGDAEPEIIAECFSALLAAEPFESIDFVAAYLDDDAIEMQEAAALALGESRHDEAFERLRLHWEQGVLTSDRRRMVLRAIALQHHQQAFDFLLARIEQDSERPAIDAIEVLAIYRHNDKLRAQVAQRVQQRGAAFKRAFAKAWD